MSFTLFQNEITSFQAIKTRSSKSRKIAFFSKRVNARFRSKNGHFSNFFFLGNIGQENVFYDILERKNAFLGYKNKKFKKSKNCHFSKMVIPWFWSKNGHFPNFFFQAMQAWKMSFTIFQNKKRPFQAIKRRSSNSRKIDIFQRHPWFCFKDGHFSNFFFFWQNWAGKCLLRYSRTKKRLSRKKNHEFIKVKNSYFSKGVNPCFWSKNGRFSNLFLTRIRLGKCLLRYSRTKKRRSRL